MVRAPPAVHPLVPAAEPVIVRVHVPAVPPVEPTPIAGVETAVRVTAGPAAGTLAEETAFTAFDGVKVPSVTPAPAGVWVHFGVTEIVPLAFEVSYFTPETVTVAVCVGARPPISIVCVDVPLAEGVPTMETPLDDTVSPAQWTEVPLVGATFRWRYVSVAVVADVPLSVTVRVPALWFVPVEAIVGCVLAVIESLTFDDATDAISGVETAIPSSVAPGTVLTVAATVTSVPAATADVLMCRLVRLISSPLVTVVTAPVAPKSKVASAVPVANDAVDTSAEPGIGVEAIAAEPLTHVAPWLKAS
jgi:hypothetical protein